MVILELVLSILTWLFPWPQRNLPTLGESPLEIKLKRFWKIVGLVSLLLIVMIFIYWI